jgi:hypothetical protein
MSSEVGNRNSKGSEMVEDLSSGKESRATSSSSLEESRLDPLVDDQTVEKIEEAVRAGNVYAPGVISRLLRDRQARIEYANNHTKEWGKLLDLFGARLAVLREAIQRMDMAYTSCRRDELNEVVKLERQPDEVAQALLAVKDAVKTYGGPHGWGLPPDVFQALERYERAVPTHD